MKRPLRNRLLRNVSLPLILGLIAIGVGSYHSSKEEAEEIYDAQLAHFAHVLHELILPEIEEGDVSMKVIPIKDKAASTPYEKDFSYRVWLNEALILQSDNAQQFGPRTQAVGFTDRMINHQIMRLFVLKEGPLTVEVAEDYHARTDLLHDVALSILVPYFFIIPLLVLAIFLGLRIGLKPLDKLSAYVASISPDEMTQMKIDVNVPRELEPFVNSINQLMERVDEAIEREKRFTGYAAHELRTPLAALKTQLQVALREKDEDVRKEMFVDAVESIDRMAHLVSQLLQLLRTQNTEQVMAQLDVSEIAKTVVRDFETLIAQKNQHFTYKIEPEIMYQANADMLHLLMRNLIDNATRYSPEHAQISLELKLQDGNGLYLRVHNTGVNLAQEDTVHMFEPFYRGKTSVASGAGLGLAIVSWIAKMHQLQLKAVPEGQGLAMYLTSIR